MASRRETLFVAFAALALLGYLSLPHGARTLVSAGDWFFGGAGPYRIEYANALYASALLLDRSVPNAWHQRARIDFLKGNFDEALAKIERQIALHGDSFMASYYIRGLIHGYRQEYAPAARDFETFLEWDPENWAARNDLAWVYFSAGDFLQARDTAAAALLGSPDNPWLLTMRGMSRFNLGDIAGAREDLEAAERHAARLSEREWRVAYPGNDPAVAGEGLASMRRAIAENLSLVNKRLREQSPALY